MQYDEVPKFDEINLKEKEHSSYESLELELDEFRDDLSWYNDSEEQQNELLQVLLNIMVTFVNIGWDVDTVQIILPELFKKVSADSNNLLGSDVNDVEPLIAAEEVEKGESI